MQTSDFISRYNEIFSEIEAWEQIKKLELTLIKLIKTLNSEYEIKNNIAIHKTATVHQSAIIKSPAIIGENTFIGNGCLLRNGVFIGNNAVIGSGCEIKTSIIFDNSSIAHFNFIGDSIIGNNVNLEAGSITANHYNERENKTIFVKFREKIINTEITKFGALVGDNSKIGANAVLSPGTILEKGSIVKRLELVEQIKN
ncbi:MAG: DapH/DapD/GlmU-related protein [Cruoricaptor ignavus]|nr:DapH/DapD/GlmU-related protein [Cruoricaptor ignavus]